MSDEDRALLAFLERHWRELTLRDARVLGDDAVARPPEEIGVKDSLTPR